MDIVVARYKENIGWITHDPSIYKDCRFFVYNKGPKIPNYPTIDIPNVGRETETYFRHIVENYDSLAEHTLFIQAEPFFHAHIMIGNVGAVINHCARLKDEIIQFDSELSQENLLVGDDYKIREYSEFLFGKKFDSVIFSQGCQWRVSRNLIRRHPLETYKKILTLVTDSEGRDEYAFDPGYISPWAFERLFPHVFMNPIMV
jgi:hypothetical protein